ncbi:MAG: transcription elongation factor NusA [Mycobacterium sp.]
MSQSRDILHAALAERVPEVADGSVEIVSAAREPGRWAKVAVRTRRRGLNPASVCIGWAGVRVADVQKRMGGEHISVIRFDPEPTRYVLNALAVPAVSAEVTDAAQRNIRVIVARADYPRALGKAGQNVRLTRRLTGWNVQICTTECQGSRHCHPARGSQAQASYNQDAAASPNDTVDSYQHPSAGLHVEAPAARSGDARSR